MNVRVVLAASSLTVRSGSPLQFWATVITIIVGVLAITTYLNKLRRAAFQRYHDDIRSVVATQLLPITSELSPNHGASVKDKVDSIVTSVDHLTGTVTEIAGTVDKHEQMITVMAAQVQQLIDQSGET